MAKESKKSKKVVKDKEQVILVDSFPAVKEAKKEKKEKKRKAEEAVVEEAALPSPAPAQPKKKKKAADPVSAPAVEAAVPVSAAKKEKKKEEKKGPAPEVAEAKPVPVAKEAPAAPASEKKKKAKKQKGEKNAGAANGADESAADGVESSAQGTTDPEQRSARPSGDQSLEGEASGSAEEGGRKPGTAANAFQRVKAEEWIDKRGSWDNSYVGTFGEQGWGFKAQQILGQVRGKDFRHEKTKKKRGSYKGGLIDSNTVSSYKFDSDDE